ncbi:hypothetical protein NLU13_2215 [Sarocladium strictum]|uniref:Protein kinase domain-containing protein n=1 Tax=Sarocladium strictum TaxID=5046 RepID=A0AA39LD31_SARSR|nr:hypothetical protein NLU13_2215 [Sarocladium strictum]
MEPVSLTIGVVGFAVQCFDAIVSVMTLLQNLRDADNRTALLGCKLQIEQHILLIWGREHGMKDGTLATRIPEESQQRLVLVILQSMLALIGESDKLRLKYGIEHVAELPARSNTNSQHELGLRTEAQAASSVPLANFTYMHISSTDSDQAAMPSSETADATKKRLQSWRTSLPLLRKCSWVVKDAKKFEELIDNLRYFNESLVRLTNTRTQTVMAASNALLSNCSTAGMQTLAAASSAQYPEMASAAVLGSTVAEADRMGDQVQRSNPTSQRQRDMRILTDQLQLAHKSASRALTTAVFASPTSGEQNVIIQWRVFQSSLDPLTRPKTIRRIEGTARVLSQAKPASICVLDCCGYVCQDDKMGYVFSYPSGCSSHRTPRTLFQMIDSSSGSRHNVPPPPLETRMELAKKLCTTIYWIHVSGIVHKGIRSDNVLLFRWGAECTERITDPFLIGFDHSRRDDDATVTRTASSPEQDMYRHPDALFSESMRSTKLQDLYSLGLVLLEIGSWFSLRQLAGDTHVSELRDHLLADGGPVSQLPYRMGTRYMEMVKLCIQGSFDIDEDEVRGNAVQEAFLKEVIEEIIKIRV